MTSGLMGLWLCASALLSFLGVAAMRRWAERRRILDIPGERSSHDQPTPRGGGLAIVAVSLAGLILAWWRLQQWPASLLLAFLAGSLAVATISWLDDLRSRPAALRLAVHSLAALALMAGAGYWDRIWLPLLGPIELGWLGLPLTFLWVVGLSNAYNFMDGIDGIAGSQAVTAGLGWAALGALWGVPLASLAGLLLAGTALGFLIHNWPPARIFMGDVGSAYLGFAFAALPIMASVQAPQAALAGIALVFPFVFDTALTLVRRRLRGENIFSAHKSHLYQRLHQSGLSHQTVTLLYSGLGTAMCLAALAWGAGLPGSGALLLLSAAVTAALPLLLAVGREKRRP